MTRLLHALRLLARLAVFAVVFVATLEVCARLDDYLAYGEPLLASSSLEDLKQLDDGTFRGKPHARFEKWQLNNLGFRGADVNERKQPGRIRVLVLGASETFGLYESPEMEYAAQLQRLLERRVGAPVEVLNAGLPGMSLPRVTLFCERSLARLQPDVVFYYPTPAGYLDEEPPAATRLTQRPPTPNAQRPAPFRPRLPRKTQNLVKSLLPRWALDDLSRREIRGATGDRPDSWFYRTVPKDRVELFRRDLEALVRCVRTSGARLVLATHANRFPDSASPSDDGQLLTWRKFYPRAEGPVILKMEQVANDTIRAVGAEHGVEVADVARAVAPRPENFADFAHFTDRGATAAARTIATGVLRVLDPAPFPATAGADGRRRPRPGAS